MSHRDAMMKVTDACADDAEVLALSVVRMIAAGYSTGDVACWDMAYSGVERTLRPDSAGRLVGSLTTLVRSVRAERCHDWEFLPASCCRVTGDEQRILRLMTAARGGRPQALARAAREVTGTDVSLHLQIIARTVALVLDEVADELVARHTPRASRHGADALTSRAANQRAEGGDASTSGRGIGH